MNWFKNQEKSKIECSILKTLLLFYNCLKKYWFNLTTKFVSYFLLPIDFFQSIKTLYLVRFQMFFATKFNGKVVLFWDNYIASSTLCYSWLQCRYGTTLLQSSERGGSSTLNVLILPSLAFWSKSDIYKKL